VHSAKVLNLKGAVAICTTHQHRTLENGSNVLAILSNKIGCIYETRQKAANLLPLLKFPDLGTVSPLRQSRMVAWLQTT
jgi:hypothetical protein